MTLGIAALCLSALGGFSGMSDSVDYARSAHRGDWLRHPVYGDPSFDTFVRAEGNPIHRGAPPLEWPVNGFLFDDPQSGHWFVYVGRYAKGYAMGPDKDMDCIVYRSKDRGAHWECLGPVFDAAPFTFARGVSPVKYAPDVSVVYAEGRYHMIYDYATANSSWESQMKPGNVADNGVGYAWSERPEGPYHRTPEPVYRTGSCPPLLGKYQRGYAATLLRRKHDWLVLMMSDSGPNMSWALTGMTSKNPEGPYTPPVILRCVDGPYYHPPLLEFFPAFAHDGRIYAPATSVALNRNFQAMFRVKTEDAMSPDAWELWQDGSVWHAEAVENEAYGIWGQAFSGFVGRDRQFRVMFPARDPQGMGTINLASRPWKKAYGEGFTVSGHEGRSIAPMKKSYAEFALDAELEVTGTAAIVFDYHAPLGPNSPAADATLHALSLTRYAALELAPEAWRVVSVDDHGERHVLTENAYPTAGQRTVKLRRTPDGTLTVSVNGGPEWHGSVTATEGVMGLLIEPHSQARVRKFSVTGHAQPGHVSYLGADAILGAGESNGAWKLLDDARFRYGAGAVSLKPTSHAKWNVEGSGFSLWAPKGPEYGAADLYVDGELKATLDFRAPSAEKSHVVFTSNTLDGHCHAVALKAKDGVVPLDALEVVE